MARHNTVDEFSTTSALADLNILAKTTANREDELKNYNTSRLDVESDDEIQSIFPNFDVFVESGGIEAIISTTKFFIRGFHAIWDRI